MRHASSIDELFKTNVFMHQLTREELHELILLGKVERGRKGNGSLVKYNKRERERAGGVTS